MQSSNRFSFQSTSAGLMILIILMVMVIAWSFGPMLLHPNSYFFSAGGDGIRNYYSVAYYAKYDGGLWFTGMNYPYGEHVMYADNQFPLAFLMSLLQSEAFDISGYTVGIINYTMFVSLLLSAVFTYLLLVELKVKNWFAIPAAVAISIVSPQLQRVIGHYSLAYVFFTPLLLYLLWRMYHSERKSTWAILLATAITFFSLTHFYYLAMAGAFIFVYAAILVIDGMVSKRKFIRQAMFPLLTVLVPLILIEGLMALTDKVTDRVKIPYGFFQSYATSESVFHPPAWSYFGKLGFKGLLSRTTQGYAYIGVTADIAFCMAGLLLLLFLANRNAFKRIIPITSRFVIMMMLAAIPVLMFSMCLPWRWHMESLLDYFSFIRQFRALDRFAYVFYYVAGIFTACLFFVFINNLLEHGARFAGAILACSVFALWFADGWSNLKTLKDYYPTNNFAREFFAKENYTTWLREAGYSPGDFQAIFPLPFYHIGSEKLWVDHSVSMYVSTWASLNTGLPVVASYLGRTSVKQAFNLVQLTADTLIAKVVLEAFDPDRPFLVVTSNEECSATEHYLLSKATFIHQQGPYGMYLLPLSAFKTDFSHVRNVFANRDQLLIKQGENYFTSQPDSSIVIEDFATQPPFPGVGLLQNKGTVQLFNSSIRSGKDSLQYDASVWVKLFVYNYNTPDMHLAQLNEAGDTVSKQFVQAKNAADIYDGWARLHIPFLLTDKHNRISITLNSEDTIATGSFLLREAKTDVYMPVGSDGNFVFNNYFIPAH